MKQNYLIILLLVGLFVACSEETPKDLVDARFIKFRFYTPNVKEYYRVDYTFSTEPDNVAGHQLLLPVEFMGRDLTEDRYFGVAVDNDKTTLPADCYELETRQVFRVGDNNIDSLRVKIYRKPVLKQEGKILRLCLVPTSDFQVYMVDSLYIEIHVGDILTRPEWWTLAVEKSYLGTYSGAKYNEFIKETGIRDFGALAPSSKRQYAILFKRALEATPRLDEDGSPMIVAIPG